ncbi:hypothetical protein GCM10027055_18310 [Janibacter alkaliphilus]
MPGPAAPAAAVPEVAAAPGASTPGVVQTDDPATQGSPAALAAGGLAGMAGFGLVLLVRRLREPALVRRRH